MKLSPKQAMVVMEQIEKILKENPDLKFTEKDKAQLEQARELAKRYKEER